MKIVYESTSPEFAIGKDELQWILCSKKQLCKRGTEWGDKSYYSNLSNLLDGLAEDMFRKNTTKLNELKELDNSISEVYNLITRLSETTVGAILRQEREKDD